MYVQYIHTSCQIADGTVVLDEYANDVGDPGYDHTAG